MRVLIQRVTEASITINKQTERKMKNGLVVLLGIEATDSVEDLDWLVNKTVNLRIFNDTDGIMNCSLLDVSGDLMIVSQFTLMVSTKKGHRPSYIRAAKHEHAIPLYEAFVQKASNQVTHVITGEFGADMQIALVNDGPVTIAIDSKNRE